MTRPNWCDEATWEKTSNCIGVGGGYGMQGVMQTQRENIARAIIAAKDEGAAAQETPDENGFVVGESVEKYTGEARWQGILVARYLTTSGKRRYVVEVKPQGFQMIAVPEQLRMIASLAE